MKKTKSKPDTKKQIQIKRQKNRLFLCQFFLTNSNILIPNQTEMEIIVGFELNTESDLKKAGKKLLDIGIKLIIITLGSKGAYYISESNCGFVVAQKVKAIDTTAAGDTFIGSFTAPLKKYFKNVSDAILYATYVSSLTV